MKVICIDNHPKRLGLSDHIDRDDPEIMPIFVENHRTLSNDFINQE